MNKKDNNNTSSAITDETKSVIYSTTDSSHEITEERVVTMRQEYSSGPLPHPDLLAKYSAIINNGAERIMAMAEKEQDARLQREEKIIDQEGEANNIKRLGQWLAFLIVVALIALGSVFTFTGHEGLGYVMFGSLGGVALAGVFLGKYATSKKE